MIYVIFGGSLCRHAYEKTAMKAQNASICTEVNSVGGGASVISASETVLWHPIYTDYSVMAHYDIA